MLHGVTNSVALVRPNRAIVDLIDLASCYLLAIFSALLNQQCQTLSTNGGGIAAHVSAFSIGYFGS